VKKKISVNFATKLSPMSEKLDHVVYSKEVVEFVTVAKEFCIFVESFSEISVQDFFEKLRKFLPLIYLKGSLLPKVESDGYSEVERFISEDDWNYLRENLKEKFAQYDEYVGVFEDRTYDEDEADVHSLSEDITDIYNALKDFIICYRNGLVDVVNEALWDLKEAFDEYWGKSSVNALQIIHNLLLNEIVVDDLHAKNHNRDMKDSFISRRQAELRGEND